MSFFGLSTKIIFKETFLFEFSSTQESFLVRILRVAVISSTVSKKHFFTFRYVIITKVNGPSFIWKKRRRSIETNFKIGCALFLGGGERVGESAEREVSYAWPI